MNVLHAPRASTESRERHSYARVPGRWLLRARAGWGAVVVLTLVTVFAELPVFVAHLHTPCAGTACPPVQLSPAQVGALKGIGLSLGDYTVFTLALMFAQIAVCVGVSAVIVWRRSHDRMALLVALMLVTFGPITATTFFHAIPSPWQVPNQCLFFLANALVVLVFCLFPTGRFVPPWMRWTIVVMLAGLVPLAFAPHTLTTPIFVFFIIDLATLVVVQVHRYRRVSSPLERQQTKWVVFGLVVSFTFGFGGEVLALLFPPLTDLSSPSGSLYQLVVGTILSCLGLVVALSFGFAMLRYRLWDIDVLINRTLVYSSLTALLALVYFGLVIGLQSLVRLGTGQVSQSPVVIVASTLALVALFQPLRRRLQAIIDRRFYRQKYDAAKTLAAFSATLRQEVDLDQLGEQLVAVVQETMQPASLSLWISPMKHEIASGGTRGESLSLPGVRPGADRFDAR